MNAAALLDICRQKDLKIGSAESCTGGMLGAALTDIPGASDVFQGGFITYSNAAKVMILGVRDGTLSAFGAVSEPVAIEMAKGTGLRLSVDLAVSITGIAGPGGADHKPEGRVCFGIALKGQIWAETIEFGALGREGVRIAARNHALELLLRASQGLIFI